MPLEDDLGEGGDEDDADASPNEDGVRDVKDHQHDGHDDQKTERGDGELDGDLTGYHFFLLEEPSDEAKDQETQDHPCGHDAEDDAEGVEVVVGRDVA